MERVLVHGSVIFIKKAPPRKEDLDINETIREVIVLTHREALKNGVAVQTECCRRDIERYAENRDGAAGENKTERKRFRARDCAARDWTHGRAPHHGIDIGVVPHVEDASGARADGDAENCSDPI
jgi:hypothetical protein